MGRQFLSKQPASLQKSQAPATTLQPRSTPLGSLTGNQAMCRLLRAAKSSDQTEAGSVVPPVVHDVLATEGSPLLPATREFFGRRFGFDFSQVRVHADSEAAKSADAVNALAYTVGRDVVFAVGQYSPNSEAGRQLLAHELAHVIQQRHATPSPQLLMAPGNGTTEREAVRAAEQVIASVPSERSTLTPPASLVPRVSCGAASALAMVQRRINPEDVSSEMIGQTFELTEEFSSGALAIKAGTRVKVVAWDNAKATVSIEYNPPAGAPVQLDVPKRILRATHAPVAGMSPYSAGARGQAAAATKAEKELATWVAKEDEYKMAGTMTLWSKEKSRREKLVQAKTAALNRKLIQETMYNRFDDVIKREVDLANKAAGFKGGDALDPNLLKSLLFQESQLGTAGKHLEQRPGALAKTRFNLGQVIDSSRLALLTMLEREQPALIAKYRLDTIRTDLAAAQNRHKELTNKAAKSAAEAAELAVLKDKAKGNWEGFIGGYRAAGSPVGFPEAIAEFLTTVPSGAPPKNLDYEFWIHLAVLWLFKKHAKGMSWPAAIAAYNGSGQGAKDYRKAVTKRAAAAAAADKAGTEYVPGGI